MEDEWMSHEDFKMGIETGTVKLGIMNLSEYWKLSFKPYMIMIEIIINILNVLLIIAIPVLSLIFHNWSLLYGFVGCFLGWILHLICIGSPKSVTRIKRTKIIFLLLLVASAFLIYNFGVVSLNSFILACTLCEFFMFYFSGNYLIEMAIHNLVNNEDYYYSALNNGIIKTVRNL